MPVRKIPRNYRSVTGYVPSVKVGRSIAYESTLERDFFLLQEFSDAVEGFVEQPVRISYLQGRSKRTHVPDAIVIYKSPDRYGRRLELADIKYRADLREHWHEYRPWLRASMAYARERRWKYSVWSEYEIRGATLQNARLLLPLRRRTLHPFDDELLAMLRTIGAVSIDDAITHAQRPDAAEPLRSLLRLIAHRKVLADLTAPLCRTTIVYAAV